VTEAAVGRARPTLSSPRTSTYSLCDLEHPLPQWSTTARDRSRQRAAKPLVEAPKETDAPKIEKKVDGTSVSARQAACSRRETRGSSRFSGNGIFERRFVVLDDKKNVVIDPATGQPKLLDKTALDHSIRAFVGHKHAFNKEVTLSLGLEYLQSVVDTDRYRSNADALFAAKVGGGLAVGLGVSGRYDHQPLPGKETLDTATTLSLIYAFSDIPEKKTCPCPDPAPPVEAPAPPPAPPVDDAAPPPSPPADGAPISTEGRDRRG
jgi:hypothetical protein